MPALSGFVSRLSPGNMIYSMQISKFVKHTREDISAVKGSNHEYASDIYVRRVGIIY